MSLVRYNTSIGPQFLDSRSDKLTRHSIFDLHAPDDRAIAAEHFVSVNNSEGQLDRWDIKRQKKSGNILRLRETARAIGSGSDATILMICENIDGTYLLTQMPSYQTTRDELTGLAKRSKNA